MCPVNRNTPSVGETQKYPEPIQVHGVTVALRSPKPSVRVQIFVHLQIWRVRITVSTSDFHSGNRSSILLPATRKTSGCGPVGRASGLGPEGRTFEPCHPDRVGTKPAQAFRNEAPDFTGSKLVGNRIPTGCQETYSISRSGIFIFIRRFGHLAILIPTGGQIVPKQEKNVVIVQLVERHADTVEVGGSSPPFNTAMGTSTRNSMVIPFGSRAIPLRVMRSGDGLNGQHSVACWDDGGVKKGTC